MATPTEGAAPESALRKITEDPTSRKRFLKMAGAGGAGALSLLIAACGSDSSGTGEASAPPATTGSTSGGGGGDVKIVNYALTLEYLEADFYKQVVDAKLLKGAQQDLAKKFGEQEQEHVDALKKAVQTLGGTPAEVPKTNFQLKDAKSVLATAAMVENLGAAAYLGQTPKIENADILASALAIHSVEARHAAALNSAIGLGFTGDGPLKGSIPDGAFAKPMDMDAVLKAIQPFLA